jgi:hypothetical protein
LVGPSIIDSDAKPSKRTLVSRKYVSWKKSMEIDERGLITSGEDDLGRLEELGTERESAKLKGAEVLMKERN